MTWTVLPTWTGGETITSTFLNNIWANFQETAPAKATVSGSIFVGAGANTIGERIPDEANVDTGENTATTTYTNLATNGPVLTCTSGTQILVITTCQVQNSGANISWASFEITGATTSVATDTRAIIIDNAATTQFRGSACSLEAVTPGSNTLRMQYRVTSGTGTFTRRRILVIPL